MTEALQELLRKQLLAELLTGLQELCRHQAQNRWQRHCIKNICYPRQCLQDNASHSTLPDLCHKPLLKAPTTQMAKLAAMQTGAPCAATPHTSSSRPAPPLTTAWAPKHSMLVAASIPPCRFMTAIQTQT